LVVLARWEWMWLLAGAALVVEGTSVLLQTGILVPLFRRVLTVKRFGLGPTFIPHTDFPLPFLATPFHHHLSLAGLGPLQTVVWMYGIASIGAVLSVLGTLGPHSATWAIAALGVGLYVAIVSWSLTSKGLFLLWSEGNAGGMITLCRGVPYKVGRLRLYVETGDQVRDLPSASRAEVAPWLARRLNRHDAAAVLGLCAWIAGDRDSAAHRWRSLPVLSLILRESAAVRLVDHARSSGQLDGLLQNWEQALGQVYQAGRLGVVCARLARVASSEGMDSLAHALRERAEFANHELWKVEAR